MSKIIGNSKGMFLILLNGFKICYRDSHFYKVYGHFVYFVRTYKICLKMIGNGPDKYIENVLADVFYSTYNVV